MLGGIDPVIIFQFQKKQRTDSAGNPIFGPEPLPSIAKIPLISEIPTFIEEPPIPIYLAENLTGLFIDSEDKNVDIETDTQTQTNGAAPTVQQKGLASTVTISLKAVKDSVGITLLSAMIDLLFEKVTSNEYAITYIHGPTTIFRAILHSYSVSEVSENDLITIKIELSRGNKSPAKPPDIPVVGAFTGGLPGPT